MSETLFNLPSQSRETDERFTPHWVFDALGETFDLDPASPVGITTAVPAAAVYTKDDDGLVQPWRGFVWVNPPFSNGTAWADRFLEHGNGIWLGPVANSAWFQRLVRATSAFWLMRDFAFWHPTHAGKRSSMPLAMFALGDRAAVAVTRAGLLLPDAGVLVQRIRGGGMSDASDDRFCRTDRPCRHVELPDTLWPRLRTADMDARNLAQDKATLIALVDRLATRIARVEAIVNPKCTCPGACSGPPRKVRAEDIRAALRADVSDDSREEERRA